MTTPDKIRVRQTRACRLRLTPDQDEPYTLGSVFEVGADEYSKIERYVEPIDPSDPEQWDRHVLALLTVAEIQPMCAARDLARSGTKGELIARLLEHRDGADVPEAPEADGPRE